MDQTSQLLDILRDHEVLAQPECQLVRVESFY